MEQESPVLHQCLPKEFPDLSNTTGNSKVQGLPKSKEQERTAFPLAGKKPLVLTGVMCSDQESQGKGAED